MSNNNGREPNTAAAIAALTLDHFAETAIVLDRTLVYEQATPHTYGKPRGIWVSVRGEDDWPSWCQSEGFHLVGLTTRHDVVLHPDANILLLSTSIELRAFTDEFGIREAKSYGSHSWVDLSTDWARVAREHDGIVIAPYQWSERLDLSWYYGWDVASGCIWNLDAIAALLPAYARAEDAR